MATSTVSVRWQTAIPSVIREALDIQPHMKLGWLVDENIIYVRPIPENPVQALRGMTIGENLLSSLLQERRQERKQEAAEGKRWRRHLSSTRRQSSPTPKKKRV